MPLGETLAILATLATALQSFRPGRNPSEHASPDIATPDPVPLLSLNAVLASVTHQAETYRSQLHRLDALCAGSGVILIIAAVLGFQGVGSAALLIVNIPIFAVVVISAIGVKYLTPIESVVATFDHETISRVLEHARRVEALNQGRLAVLNGVTDALRAGTAAQVLVLAIWATVRTLA